MRTLLLILLFAFASCTNAIVPTERYCIEYHIGDTWTVGEVTQSTDGVRVNDWVMQVTQTPDNKTVLTCETHRYEANVHSITAFEFDNVQAGDTVRGIYINHTWGSDCNTTDTLPVWFVRVPCKESPPDHY